MSAIEIIKERAQHSLAAHNTSTTHGARMGHLYAFDAYRDALSLLSLYGNSEATAASEEVNRVYQDSDFCKNNLTAQPA